MASRILHLAVAERIIDRIPIKDKNRFRFGILLPDAYRADAPKADSHLKISVCGKKTYDLQRFRDVFGVKIKTDELYTGYYLHLIQDMVFRRIVYEEYNWNPRIPGNVERLWKDYEHINSLVITYYGLKNDLELPNNFFNEEINTIYPFDVHTLCSDLNRDFEEIEKVQDYTAFFFTKEMASEFISKATEVCVAEINALQEENAVKFYNYAW